MPEDSSQTSADPTVFATAGVSTVVVPPQVRQQYPDLIELMMQSESMNNAERQYWIDILPVMTEDQIDQLRQILVNEQEQLAAIDKKYADAGATEQEAKVRVAQTTEERKKRRTERSSEEQAVRSTEEVAAEQLLNEM